MEELRLIPLEYLYSLAVNHNRPEALLAPVLAFPA